MAVNRLTIWDCSLEPSSDGALIYTWNGFAEAPEVRSLLRYAEENADRLRRTYLAFVHELGETQVRGKRIIDHLALDDGLSYWWMTPFVERSLLKSPSTTDLIRLLALEEVLLEHRPASVHLVTRDRRLRNVTRDLCRRMKAAFTSQSGPRQTRQPITPQDAYAALPHPVQAVVSLGRYAWSRWPLRTARQQKWFEGPDAVLFCSYFFNLHRGETEQGRFESAYWTGIGAVLGRLGRRSNWLQHFVPSQVAATPEAAIRILRHFNDRREANGAHAFLEAHLSWGLLRRVLAGWLRLSVTSMRMRGVSRAFRHRHTGISLWPYLRYDWHAAVRGRVAISNLLHVELFDTALRELPHQSKGLYLCENQPWERALIRAWRKYRHGELIAVAHSTVRFWDLRYFTDPRTLQSQDPLPIPQPDITALNGPVAVEAYRGADYPAAAIAECEALRYGYLKALRARPVQARPASRSIRVLVVADYLPSVTRTMLRLVEAAGPGVQGPATYTVKPHPKLMVEPSEYPGVPLKIVTDPLEHILMDYDVVVAANQTSAAVDAYLSGLPVIVILDDTELNFSPLRGLPGARFVHTADQLRAAVQVSGRDEPTNLDPEQFFFLDPDLPRWQQLLATPNESASRDIP